MQYIFPWKYWQKLSLLWQQWPKKAYLLDLLLLVIFRAKQRKIKAIISAGISPSVSQWDLESLKAVHAFTGRWKSAESTTISLDLQLQQVNHDYIQWISQFLNRRQKSHQIYSGLLNSTFFCGIIFPANSQHITLLHFQCYSHQS